GPVLTAVHDNKSRIGVIDIFAGPGGLGEGFSGFETPSVPGHYPFQLIASAEMDEHAHGTLRLRSFYRLLVRQEGKAPAQYWEFLRSSPVLKPETVAAYFSQSPWKALWEEASAEALNVTLGPDSPGNKRLFE